MSYRKWQSVSGWSPYRYPSGISWHRIGSALNLNIHFHILFLEGFYQKGTNEFYRVNTPTNEDIAKVLSTIGNNVNRFLQKRGYLTANQQIDHEHPELFESEHPALASCIGASVQHKIGLGERAGQRVRKIGALPYQPEDIEFKGPLCGSLDWFTLHTRTHVEASRRDLLEKLLRYVLRPSLALDRLSLTDDGNVLYRLKTPYRDGTSHILLSPMEIIEKLVAIIPPPRINLTRYHGCLAPHANIRAAIVPTPETNCDTTCPHLDDETQQPHRAYRISWMNLLKRVFDSDLQCDCGGKMKIISTITDGSVIRKILTPVGLSPDPPPLSPSRLLALNWN